MKCLAAGRLIGQVLIVLALLAGPAWGATYNVTSAGDAIPSGTTPCTSAPASCTLRAALAEGNNNAGPHTITFAVPKVTLSNGGGLYLQAAFIITGSPTPRTIIDGGGNACFSLNDAQSVLNPKGANGSILSNLSIQHCNGDAISANGHGFKFLNNTIGTDVTGMLATATTANTGHGISISSSHVYVAIDSSAKVNTFLQGLYTSFPFPLPDVTLPDVSGQINKFSSNLLTALAALTDPVIITGNVISGNGQNGIEIFSQNLAGVIVAGNMIGTDALGTHALPNKGNGVHFIGSPFGNLVGPGNVISGNAQNGVSFESSDVLLPNFVMGNRIGLGTADTAQIGNGLSGVLVSNTVPSSDATNYNATSLAVVIGPQNLIGDNQGGSSSADPDTLGSDEAGVIITGTSTKVKVVANTIGIGEYAGTPVASVAHGNSGDGIIITASGNTIDGNTIAGNSRHGIVVKLSSTAGTTIVNNHIGLHPGLSSNMTLGNAADGVHIDSANATTVGGTGTTDANRIAANKRHGIALRNGGTDNGWQNLFQRNLTYHNTKLAIDLDHPRNAADDPSHTPYPQNYPNLDQNQPVICTSAAGACAGFAAPTSNSTATKLDWTLVTKPSATYRLEFFKLNAATQSATSMSFLGDQTISTDSSGNLSGCSSGRCTSTVTGSTQGAYVVMTATDITKVIIGPGNPSWLSAVKCFVLNNCTTDSTSEFSNLAQPATTGGAIAPTATTGTATDLSDVGAMVHGTVSTNGAATTVQFAYGATTTYDKTMVATQSPLADAAGAVSVSSTLTGLTCHTTYHFRVEAQNSAGAGNGADQTFITAACPKPPGSEAGVGTDAGALEAGTQPPPAPKSGGCSFAGAMPVTSGCLALLLAAALALALRRRR